MKKQLTFALLLLSLCACDTIEMVTPDPQTQVGELVNIQIGATEATTKVTYEPNSNNSVYAFSWEIGDEVSVIVPSTDNSNQKFTATTAEASTLLEGQIATWSGNQTLYAVYPYSATGYTIDSEAKTLFFDNSSQTIDVTAGVTYDNGLMVVAVDGASVVSEDEFDIPDLSFTQVMSLFELDLVDIPDGERCTTIGFEAGADLFIASADIDLATGEVTPRTYSSSVSASVDSYTGDSASFNFALFPVDLSGTAVTLYVTTISDTDTKKYTYQMEEGVNFAANSFLYSEEGELTLQDDFTESGTGVLYLADFDDGFIPEDDTWVICDVEATTASFTGLKSALDNVYAADSSRRISIELPYLNAIPNLAFSDGIAIWYALQSVSAPAALSIGESPFPKCVSLTTVDSPLITSIGSYAFYQCTSLSTANYPLVTSIATNAFYNCKSLTTIDFPQLTTIGSYAFYTCSSLTSVNCPQVTSIDDYTFYICSSLKTAYFPLATLINSYAFNFCSSLTTADFPIATSIDTRAFYNCTSLATVNFPKVTSVEESAFSKCSSLTTVDFPKVTSVGINTFNSCTSLSTINFPLVKSIGDYAFQFCSSLKSVDFPQATSIKNYMFDSCTLLTTIDCPVATSIEQYAFKDCSSLININFPLITSIGSTAFKDCIALSDAAFPSVTSISDYAFYNCDALRTLSLATNDDTVLLSLGTDVFHVTDTTSNDENITLTLGLSNKDNVVDNTLTVGSNSYTFKKIILSGGSESGLTATSNDGVGKAW